MPHYFDQIASISQRHVLLFPVALPVRAGLITWTERQDGRFAAMVRYGEGNMWGLRERGEFREKDGGDAVNCSWHYIVEHFFRR